MHPLWSVNVATNRVMVAQSLAQFESLAHSPIIGRLALRAVAKPMGGLSSKGIGTRRQMQPGGASPRARAKKIPSAAAEVLETRRQSDAGFALALFAAAMVG